MKKILFLLLFFLSLQVIGQSAPSASNVSSATVKNTNATINLVARDADDNSLTYSIVSAPSNGTTSLSGSTVTYTPTTNFTGN
ncbi:MAG: Ig-like domain-containing protein, partial [Flavobacteriales bacterium]